MKAKVSDKMLLKMCGDVAKARANFKCEYPNCSINGKQLHPHHYYSKRNANTRYDPDNIIVLCAYHHTLGNEAAHHDPNFKDVIISNFIRTNEWHWNITEKKNKIVKNNQEFKEAWKERLKVLLDIYKRKVYELENKGAGR